MFAFFASYSLFSFLLNNLFYLDFLSLSFYCTTLAKRNHPSMYMYELTSNHTNAFERETEREREREDATEQIDKCRKVFFSFFLTIYWSVNIFLPYLKSIGQTQLHSMRTIALLNSLVRKISNALFNFTSRFASSTVMSNNCCLVIIVSQSLYRHPIKLRCEKKNRKKETKLYIYIHTHTHSLVELNKPSDILIVEKEWG